MRSITGAGVRIAALLLAAALLLSGCPSADSLYGSAYALYSRREEAQALELLDRIIARDAAYTPAYLLRGTIYELRGDWDEAERALLEAKAKAPPSHLVCFNLGNLYFKLGQYRRAVDEYTLALAVNPGFNDTFLNRANARMMLKEYRPALEDYEAFLKRTGRDYPNVRELVKLLRQDLDSVPK